MTFLKTFWAAFLAVVAASALAGLVFTMVRGTSSRKAPDDLANISPPPSSATTQGNQIRVKRDVTVTTSTGDVTLTEGTWLYLQGESAGVFTCYYQGQQIQVHRADAEIVTWK